MNPYILKQSIYEKNHSAFYETLFTLSNGYVGLRSTVEFDSEYSIPGAFFRNFYDYGLSVPNHLVNGPNWLDIKLSVDDEKINYDFCKIHDYERVLDMKQAIVSIYVRFEDSQSRLTDLRYSYYVHSSKNISVISGEVVALNYSGKIKIDFGFDYSTGNSYHGGYYGTDVKSFQIKLKEFYNSGNKCTALFMTKGSEKPIRVSSYLLAEKISSFIPFNEKRRIGTSLVFNAKMGINFNFSRYVAFELNDNDSFITQNYLKDISQSNLNSLFNEHKLQWQKKWNDISLTIDGEFNSYQALIFGTFQLLQVMHDLDDFNIPARGLSSEYHHGHFFFNSELYKVPFYSWHYPSKAKAMLMYRARTKQSAMEYAQLTGFEGLRWSEESGPDGEPAGPTRIYNFKKGTYSEEWTGRLVKHIGSNIVYSILQYAIITGDHLFVEENMDILIGVSRFYASALVWDQSQSTYTFNNVIGPDEYHIDVNNNFYTNYLSRWCINELLMLIKTNESLLLKWGISEQEVSLWEHIVANIKIPLQDASSGVFEQFDGYFGLAEKKVSEYDDYGRPVMDEKLYENTRNFMGDGTKIIKQCDVVMLMSLLRNDFDKDIQTANFNYYDPRTMHESSLSATHAGIVAADIGNVELAHHYFLFSARYNLDFNPKEDYNNGLHIAAFAGSWLILLYGFLGIKYEPNKLMIRPSIPLDWNSLSTNLVWNGYRLNLTATHKKIIILLLDGPQSLTIRNNYLEKILNHNESFEHEIDDSGVNIIL